MEVTEIKIVSAEKRRLKVFYIALILILQGICTASPAHAVFIANVQGGADFPQGAVSFADALVSYSPGLVGSVPTEPHRGALNSLGVPDFAGVESCLSQADCTFVSLGKGGSIVMRFTDNKLTGSGNNNFDLWIFEVGSSIEATFVEISNDGTSWFLVGKAFGSTFGIDIDAFGFGPNDLFSFVRLTDDPNEGDHDSWTAGADVDAVGAISTSVRIQQIQQLIPEPASLESMCFGLLALLIACRHRRT